MRDHRRSTRDYHRDFPVSSGNAFAGAAGLFKIAELIPVVGFIPLFTIAAFAHSPKEE
jgi:hypothetical protein